MQVDPSDLQQLRQVIDELQEEAFLQNKDIDWERATLIPYSNNYPPKVWAQGDRTREDWQGYDER